MKYLTNIGAALAVTFGLAIAIANPSQAAVVVDPAVGGTYDFNWDDGLGQIDGIDLGPETEWSMTVAVDSVLSLVTAADGFVVGDEFELVVDGLVVAWDSISTTGPGYFVGESMDLFLSAGTHTFTLNLTTLAAGFMDGGAFMEFGTTSAAVAPVPLPAGGLLLFGALGGLGLIRRRRKTA